METRREPDRGPVLPSVSATEVSYPGAIGVMLLWSMFAVGVVVPVAVFTSSSVAPIATAAAFLVVGIVIVRNVYRTDRAGRAARIARRQRLDQRGICVDAVVRNATRPETGLVGIGDRFVVLMQLEATVDGTSRKTDVECLVDPIELPRVQPGCKVELRYDPEDPSNCEVALPFPVVA